MQDFLRKAKLSFSFQTGAKEITRICQPFLNELGFKNFYYCRITKQGRLIYLTNQVDFAMDYWEAGLPLRTGFHAMSNETQSSALQWDDIQDKEILDFVKIKNCHNGFSFVDRYPGSIQFATFLRSSPLENSSRFYQENQIKLRCWLREFEIKNRNLINQAEQNPLNLPEDYLSPQKESFYPEKTVPLKFHNIQAKISFRQLDCLHLYTKGFTAPRIAELLELSSRTVEIHLEAVKDRFGLSTRDELAALAYANPFIESYSPRFLK